MVATHYINLAAKRTDGISGTDFQVNKFEKHSLHQIMPFNNQGVQNFALVLYFNHGNECSSVNDSFIPHSGYLLFKPPGKFNHILDHRDTVNGCYIQFNEKFLLTNRQLLSIVSGFPFFDINLLQNMPLRLDNFNIHTLKELCSKIYEEYNRSQNADLEMMCVYLQTLFLHVKRIFESFSFLILSQDMISNNQSREIVRKFQSLVWLHSVSKNDKVNNRKTVAEYADLLFIHPNYLYALVKKETGKTAREYIDEQTFKLAKSLLSKQELLIKEIACQLSFNETAHFTNFFRRHAGISPGVFRKQHFSVLD